MSKSMEQTEDKNSYINMLKYLLVVDLKDLLAEFNKSKNGLKSILFKRAKELLDTENDKIYHKIKELYNARCRAKNAKQSDIENENLSEKENLSEVPECLEKSNSNLPDHEENSKTNENQESMEIETRQNAEDVEPSLVEIQTRLENLDANEAPEKNTQITSTLSVLSNICNLGPSSNIQTIIQNASSLYFERIGLVPEATTNLLNKEQLIDQNISRISTNIQSMRELFNEKFKQMEHFKYVADIEEATMLIPRPKVSFKTVISLNKIKTMDIDFTKYYHVNRMLLVDFFLNKRYEIHLRIACDPLRIVVPHQIKIFINRERYFYSRLNNFISINLTPHFLRQFKTFNPIYFEFNETDICKNYFCGIYLFRKLSNAEIKANKCFGLNNSLDKVDYVKNSNVWDKNITINMLKEKLNPSQCEFEIVTDYIKVSLTCPLTKMRIKLPSRGKKCQHIQCFDLESYIALNEKSEKWTCPLCDKIITFSDLIIDSLIKEIVNETKCDEVKLDGNGKWTEINSESSTETSFTDTIIISEKDNSCIILD